MKITNLDDLEVSRETVSVSEFGYTYKIVKHYSRSPNADELIALSGDEYQRIVRVNEPFPWNLRFIGFHPESLFLSIWSRTDCGPFWRTVAVAKYKLFVAGCWLKNRLFGQLYLSGMLAYSPGEELSWSQLRLDWLLITNVIASAGLTVCCFGWLLLKDYGWSLICLLLGLMGWLIGGVRRNVLIRLRDRELRSISLQALFQLHEVIPDALDFGACLDGLMDPTQVISVYRARAAIREQENREQEKETNCCQYQSSSQYLRCAVHPDHYSLGLCNQNCPSFSTANSQLKN